MHRRFLLREELQESLRHSPAVKSQANFLLIIFFFISTGTGITVNAVHPGIVNTDILRHSSYYDSWLSTVVLKPLVWLFIKSPRQGAQTIVYASLDPSLENVSGKYFA
jgi:hypothetical protein